MGWKGERGDKEGVDEAVLRRQNREGRPGVGADSDSVSDILSLRCTRLVQEVPNKQGRCA